MVKNAILLESGTNEVEILEFKVGDNSLGINVIKVREVINLVPVTRTPHAHRSIEGLITLREETIPLIDLTSYLDYPDARATDEDKIIITELNKLKAAFRINSVVRIHRVSWEQIHKPPHIVQANGCIIGLIRGVEGHLVLLLDFENILYDIELSHTVDEPEPEESMEIPADKLSKQIVIAEDSPTLRKILTDYLPQIGYQNLQIFENGALAWAYLDNLARELKEDFLDTVQLVITDIEMPQMDGHHLIKRIKSDPLLSKLPTIIFSSLITDDLRHKGFSVGADAQVSKPDFKDLSSIIKKLLLSPGQFSPDASS